MDQVYDNVLNVRVHKLVPNAVWQPRYEHINASEPMLSNEGVSIFKFFLHISKEEQAGQALEDCLQRLKRAQAVG